MHQVEETLAFLFEKNQENRWLDRIPALPGQEDNRWGNAGRRLDALVYALRANGINAQPCSAQVGGVDVARFRGLLLPDIKQAFSVFAGTIDAADKEVASEFSHMKRVYTAQAENTHVRFTPCMTCSTAYQDEHNRADVPLREAMDQGAKLVEEWQYQHASPEFQKILDQHRAGEMAKDLDKATLQATSRRSAPPRL